MKTIDHPTTICAKCRHSQQHRVPHTTTDWRCWAPWPKKLDLVTGVMVPIYEDCRELNAGECIRFKPKRSLWKWLRRVL